MGVPTQNLCKDVLKLAYKVILLNLLRKTVSRMTSEYMDSVVVVRRTPGEDHGK